MNPLKKLRLATGYNQREVSDLCNLTSQAIMRAEQGLLSVPPRSYLLFLSTHNLPTPTNPNPAPNPDLPSHPDNPSLSPDDISALYYQWVYSQRSLHGSSALIQSAKAQLRNPTGPANQRIDWYKFRQNVLGLPSVASLAKLLMLQISICQDFEKNGRNVDSIEEILLNWGLDTSRIIFPVSKYKLERAFS